jgi:hypothetical protein
MRKPNGPPSSVMSLHLYKYTRIFIYSISLVCSLKCLDMRHPDYKLFSHRKAKDASGQTRDGIRKRTLSLGFLGKISRVLRLEVSTLVVCLSTRCYSWTKFIDWLFCMNFWNYKGSMVFCQVFCFVYTNKCCLFRKIIFHMQTLFKHSNDIY